MLSAEELKAYAKGLSIPASGVCGAEADSELAMHIKRRRQRFPACSFEEDNLERRCNPRLLMEDAKSIFVCLFPYYRQDVSPDNLSRYAAVTDYHRVVGAYLAKIADFITDRVPEAGCLPLCDTTPLADRWLAYRAGLGFFGKNHLLIHPRYGSWFFIGSLLLNIPLEPDEPLPGGCQDCGACQRACPGGAIAADFGFDCEKCISYLTQKKELTQSQQALLRGQDSVYGCDVCQSVCPHNQNAADTPIGEFYEGAITHLDKETISGLSGRAFKRAYGDYAFSWCSRQTILKNFR